MNINEGYFKKVVLQHLGLEYDVYKRENGSYSFFHHKYGPIDIYPKKNRMLLRWGNQWRSDAFDFINERILTEKFK
ncbi:hypothetical protein [Chryseobacterium proteolyticum]|uniref:hypothetical protein n=1 Tax=Chryseobacterium proteolyticum TaxID=118127 RepID=UPI003983B05D